MNIYSIKCAVNVHINKKESYRVCYMSWELWINVFYTYFHIFIHIFIGELCSPSRRIIYIWKTIQMIVLVFVNMLWQILRSCIIIFYDSSNASLLSISRCCHLGLSSSFNLCLGWDLHEHRDFIPLIATTLGPMCLAHRRHLTEWWLLWDYMIIIDVASLIF